MLTRRQFLSCSIGAAASAATYVKKCEPEWLELTQKKVATARGEVHGFRIAHLSDLHLSPAVRLSHIARAVDMAVAAEPDLICLTGDYITDKVTDAAAYCEVLKRLSKAAPTFACFGNHDGGAWARRAGGYRSVKEVQSLLESAGVTTLRNERRLVECRIGRHKGVRQACASHGDSCSDTAKINIVGVGDYWAGDCKHAKAFSGVSKDYFTLLLAHNPDSKDGMKSYNWDLMLSGHTHGGQVVIPLIQYAPVVPVADRKFVAGLKHWQGRYVHITRGVGNLHGIRFNCRPEVAILELAPT